MRVTFYFNANKNSIILPISYNEYIQGLIYHLLSEQIATFLHDKGYNYEKRSFKLFCFSRIHSDYYNIDKQRKLIDFGRKIDFDFCSIIDDIIINLTENQLKVSDIWLKNNNLKLEGIKVHLNPNFKSEIQIEALSPITAYSSLSKDDKTSKKTYFYSPNEKEFSELIKNNLIKKYKIVYENELKNTDFEIIPIKYNPKKNLIRTSYKDFFIIGHMGIFKLKGNIELIRLAYETGLGSKNSQGFGMWKIVS